MHSMQREQCKNTRERGREKEKKRETEEGRKKEKQNASGKRRGTPRIHLCSLLDEKCYSLRKNERKEMRMKKKKRIKERDEKKDGHDRG